ncbi:MAG TPA: peptidoglycan DD-metalloendopeptidase family protein, partial [Thermoleophilaceae bacterium]|nr:peptidoglycan DD-metalloendopeptidase family protein [Thermoleophilaceae bacterium]
MGLAAPFLVPVPGLGASLSEQITGTEGELTETRAQEGVLTTELSGLDNQIAALSGEIGALLDKEAAILEELEAKEAELEATRAQLEATRQRLARVKDRLAESENALAERLVEIYKTDEPDALTVVLQADGFEDLLERTEFLDRISDQDQEIVERVRALKAEVERELARLHELEQRIEAAITAIIDRRNELAAARQELTAKRAEIQGVRSDRAGKLAEVRQTEVHLEGNLASLKREQKRIQAELAAASEAEQGGAPSVPVSSGSGGFIYPADGALSSPFGTRWGRLHAGIDIAAPEGTPIRAAAAGTVVSAGPSGGYGNYTCIQHSGNVSTCYAHQSAISTSAGASVSQG